MRSLLVALLCVTALTPAHAKPVRNDPASRQMRAAFEEATTEYNLGHHEKALASFEIGYRVKNDPAFLFNIAQCERQLHRPVDAARSYRAFLREAPVVSDTQRAEVERLITLMDEEAAREAAAANVPPTAVAQPAPEVAPAAVVVDTPPPPPPRKRTGLWIGVGVAAGVVAIGLGVGLGIGLTRGADAPSTSLGNMSVTFK